MFVTTVLLNPQHPAAARDWADLCRMHARVTDATVGMPPGPRVLWAQITPRQGRVLLIRSTQPVTQDRLPAGYARGLVHRLWQPPTFGRHRAVMVFTPVRQKQGDGRAKKTTIVDPVEQEAWLRERLEPLVNRLQVRLVTNRVLRGWHRDGHRVVHRLVAAELACEVTKPDELAEIVTRGFGRARAYGGGLSIWEKM